MTKKKIGLISAIFIGISSILGSGSLFVPYRTATIAGPAAILVWIISGSIILLLALCVAELAALHPKRGLTAIIPTLSHNKFYGFPFAMANWLSVVAVIGLEADASIQYLINLIPNFKPYFYDHDQLTIYGNILSIFLVLIYCLLNYWGAKILVKASNILGVLKIIIPAITALVIIAVAFHPSNFTLLNNGIFHYDQHNIISAILVSGIFVSFNGFQSIVSFSSEVKNPEKNIYLSLIFSILFCLFIYLLLQIAFIGAIPPAMLTQFGWSKLQMSAPMIELALLLGLNLFTSIIYLGAVISPSGAGITFTGSASRMFTAMTRNKQMPEFLGKINPKYHVSHRSLFINTGLAILFLLAFRSWGKLAEFLSLLHIISYLPIPIALCVFRQTSLKNPSFRLRGGKIVALLLFVFFTYMLTFSYLKLINQIFILFGIGQLVFIATHARSRQELFSSIKQCLGLIVYFSGLWILIYCTATYPYLKSEKSFIFLIITFATLSFYMLTQFQRNVKLSYATVIHNL
ncbi:MAG: APC family permease [Proteobacteria bacterium]|nr:APC family permease [Pseudomonadota bacterium]